MHKGKAAPDAGTSETAKREDLTGPFRFHDNRKWRFWQCDTILNHTELYAVKNGTWLMHLRYRWSFIEQSAPPNEQLIYYRKFRGLLGKELAALIGVNHATIVNYENLKSPFDYNNAVKIAEVLQIEKELLFDDFNKFIDYPYHKKLKEVRTELHMTQVEFSAFSGINRSTLSAWEQGTWIPTRENYILLAEAFKRASEIKEG